jgi:hypothetical protein
MSANLSINQEQNAGNDGADPRDEIDDVSSQTYAQKGEADQDQVYAKQNPFQISHRIHPFNSKQEITFTFNNPRNKEQLLFGLLPQNDFLCKFL